MLLGQDCGVDVDSVENLIRRHEETEREVGVIQERSKVSVGGGACCMEFMPQMKHEEVKVGAGAPSVFTQDLQKEVSHHLKAPSVMSNELKKKQKEAQSALTSLEREVKLR